jgi:uncharacterized ParB-like nuclease family protein
MADDSDIFETIPSKPLVSQVPQTANFGAKQSEPVADGVFETIPAAPKTVPQTEPTSVEMPASDIMGNPLGGTEMVAKPSKREAEDFRTVAEMPVGGKAMFGLMFSSTPQGAENIIRQHVPEAKFDVDKFGNKIVIAPNEYGETEKFHLDKPGFNTLDFSRTVGKTVAAAPVAVGAAMLPGGQSLLGAMGYQALAGASSSALEDYVAQALGSKEPVDVNKALVSGAVGAAAPAVAQGLGTFYNLMAKDVFSDLSRGAQNYLKSISGKLQSGDIPVPKDGRDLLLDTPHFRGVAKTILKENPDSEAAKLIMGTLEQRAKDAPARVSAAVDSSLGPMTANEREIDALYKAYMGVLSDQESPLLKNAPPINPANIVSKIDSMLETAQGKTADALRRARGFFIESEATTGTAGTRKPIYDPRTGALIRHEPIPATSGKAPVYVTDAQSLENARTELDSLIRYGDDTLGIKPGELKGKNNALSQVRTDLSTLLKKEVPGYEEVMGKFVDVHDLIEANKLGQKIFTAGEQQLRPDEVAKIIADKADGDALRLSTRALVNNKLAGTADDVAGLKRILGGENDFARKSLELMFDEPQVARLMRTVEQELAYRETEKALGSVSTGAKETAGEQSYAGTRESSLGKQIKGATTSALNFPETVYRAARGYTSERYPTDLAKVMTAPAEELPAYMRGMQSSTNVIENLRRAQQFAAPAAEIAPSATPSEPRKKGKFSGGSVGRIGRASGGKVAHNIQPLVSRLMGLAEQAKKSTDSSTKPLLDAPDASIVKALRVANQAI